MTARALEWRAAARADLLAIVDYISDDNPDAAQRLKDEIEEKAAKLPDRPKLYRDASLGRGKWSSGPTISLFMPKTITAW